MKIIHIVGRSNAGKTTFIKKLIPALKGHGAVAVVKHLGDHHYTLEAGKDTTEFFESGADISVGIDTDKTVSAIRKNDLDSVLRMLFEQGIDFTIIEGFKTRAFKKIVIGDMIGDNCVLANPEVADVVVFRNLFDDYDTEEK